jgi:hypothetical protein
MFNVSAGVHRREDASGRWKSHVQVAIDQGVPIGRYRYVVRTSNVRVPRISTAQSWDARLVWSVKKRLENFDNADGRVLAAWVDISPDDQRPLAVLAWHRETSGPIYILDSGWSSNVPAPLGRGLCEVLMKALLETGCHYQIDVAPEWQKRLRWSAARLQPAPAGNSKAW